MITGNETLSRKHMRYTYLRRAQADTVSTGGTLALFHPWRGRAGQFSFFDVQLRPIACLSKPERRAACAALHDLAGRAVCVLRLAGGGAVTSKSRS